MEADHLLRMAAAILNHQQPMPALPVSSRRHLPPIALAGFLVLLESGLALWALGREPWHDEAHFVKTVVQFGRSTSVETIAHYREMSTPLPFALYGLWGNIVGFSLPALRTLSIILALATYLLCFRLCARALGRPWTAAGLTAFIAVNPYMAGASVFVFTEMITMLFVVLTLTAVLERRHPLLAVSLACAVLCRQYTVFLTVASGLLYLVRYLRMKEKADLAALGAVVLSCLPMAGLMVLWGGPAPDTDYKNLYIAGPTAYQLPGLSLYVLQLFLYLAPVAILTWRRNFGDWRLWIAAAAASQVYWLAPVEASACSLQLINRDTVGYVHRALKALPWPAVEPAVFYLSFLCALPLLFGAIRDAWQRLRSPDPDPGLFLPLAMLAFLLIQPWSYLTWEKYFLPLLPVAGLWMLLRTTGIAATGRVRTGTVP